MAAAPLRRFLRACLSRRGEIALGLERATDRASVLRNATAYCVDWQSRGGNWVLLAQSIAEETGITVSRKTLGNVAWLLGSQEARSRVNAARQEYKARCAAALLADARQRFGQKTEVLPPASAATASKPLTLDDLRHKHADSPVVAALRAANAA
jgi:hypothetical protein